MHIGLTFDLRSAYLAQGYSEEETAEFDRDDTIAALETALAALGHTTSRIGNVRELAAALVQGRRFDLVFNIAEGLHGVGREAQVPALLDAFDIPYTFSDTVVMGLTLDKAATKRVVRDLGLATPDFALVRDAEDIAGVALPYPLFAKPNAEGTGKGITPASKITDAGELRAVCLRLLAEHKQHVLVETFLPGREFTVGILGTGRKAKSIGVLEVALNPQAEQDVYSYVNKERCEELVEYRICREPAALACEPLALAVWRGLNCRDGGRVDVRLDAAGRPSFLEVNPLAGLHPEHSDLPILATQAGIAYRDLIGAIVESAAERVEPRL